MSFLTQGRYGLERSDWSTFKDGQYPSGGTKGFAGGIAFRDPVSGLVTSGSDIARGGLISAGMLHDAFDATGLTNAQSLAQLVPVQTMSGVFGMAMGTGADAFTLADAAAAVDAYAIDDQTLGRTSASGTRSIWGKVVDVDTVNSIVWVRAGNGIAGRARSVQPYARLVTAAALATYANVGGVLTATANGALATIDGVAPAVGDAVLLAMGAAGADNGLYIVTSLGSTTTKWSMQLSPDWVNVQPGTQITVGPEGTQFPNIPWKVMTAGPIVVGTTSLAIYPQKFMKTVTLAAGVYTIGAGGGGEALFLFSTTKSQITATRNTAGTPTATTGGYAAPLASRIAGVAGTAAILIQAQVAAGTLSNADTSTIDVVANNW